MRRHAPYRRSTALSFDLLFYRPAGQGELAPDELDRALAKLAHVAMDRHQDGGATYWYENPAAGVQCSFWLGTSPSSSKAEPPEFRGLQATPLGFTLDYIRPSFFAAEAMPLAVQVAEGLGLLIYDGQREDSKGRKPRRYSAAELAESWEQGNARAVRGVREHTHGYVSDCPRERLDYYWQYMSARRALEATYAEREIPTPEVLLLRPTKGGSAILVCRWPNLVPTVLPEVDYVWVQQEIRKLGGLIRRQDEGLVNLAELKEALGSHLRLQQEPVAHSLYEESPPPPEVLQALQRVEAVDLSGYERTEAGRVVDVPPG